MIPSAFTTPPIEHFKINVPAGKTVPVDVFGCACVIKECEYQPEIAFDNGGFLPWDLALSVDFAKFGFTFKKLRFKNTLAVANTIEFYAGFFDLNDRRLNIVEARNGGAASAIPLGFSEISHTFTAEDAGTAVLFADLDYNRAEIRMTPDVFGTAWYGASEGEMNGDTGEMDFRRIGLSVDGVTTLKTKAPIWIRGNEGATVRAFVFTF